MYLRTMYEPTCEVEAFEISEKDRIHKHTFLRSYDLDLDPMTSIYELNLKILEIYLYTKNELSRSRFSEVRALRTDRQMQSGSCTI